MTTDFPVTVHAFAWQHHLLGWPGITLGAVVVILVFSKFLKRKSAEYEQQIRREIARTVLDVSVPSESRHNEFLAEVETVLFKGGDFHSPELASILRVESEYDKLENGKYQFKIVVLRKKDKDSATASTVEREIPYEDLPDAVRTEMIRTRKDKAVVLHYPHKSGSK